MRAFGTPLFLKNQFGSGYQVNLLSHPDMVPRLESMVADMLPGAEVVGMNAGNMTVGMPNQALKRLPAFFQRLESEQGLVREWGISACGPALRRQRGAASHQRGASPPPAGHTTLEEVFLRLVQQNRLNQGGMGQHGAASSTGMLCNLCRHRVPEQVVVATASGSVLSMPHVVCMPCALGFPGPGASGAPDTPDGQLRGVDAELYAAIVRIVNDKAASGSVLLSPDVGTLLLGGGGTEQGAKAPRCPTLAPGPAPDRIPPAPAARSDLGPGVDGPRWEAAGLAQASRGAGARARVRAGAGHPAGAVLRRRQRLGPGALAAEKEPGLCGAHATQLCSRPQLNGQPLALTEAGREELAQAQARAQQLGATVLRDHRDAISLLQRVVEEVGEDESKDEEEEKDEEEDGALEDSPPSEATPAIANGAGETVAQEDASGGQSADGAGAATHPYSQAGKPPLAADPGADGSHYAAGGLLGPPALGHRTALAPVGAWAQTRALFLKNATLQVRARWP